MSFSRVIKEEALVRSRRSCCVCHKFSGRLAEVHHIVQVADGGSDELDNAIVLCPECHGEAGHYNLKHPKGNKYSCDELKRHRNEWWNHCKKHPLDLIPQDWKPSSRKIKPTQSKQTIIGNGNVQAGRDVIIKSTKVPTFKIQPPPGSIGSNSLLKETIQNKFNRLGEEREKRFGKSAYGQMYKTFKRDFLIKNSAWTTIWNWPEACGQKIIRYLDLKYGNTISGRIEKASRRPDHIGPMPQLFKREKELLERLGWAYKGTEHCDFLLKNFGVTSHSQIDHLQQWLLVKHLEMIANSIE